MQTRAPKSTTCQASCRPNDGTVLVLDFPHEAPPPRSGKQSHACCGPLLPPGSSMNRLGQFEFWCKASVYRLDKKKLWRPVGEIKQSRLLIVPPPPTFAAVHVDAPGRKMKYCTSHRYRYTCVHHTNICYPHTNIHTSIHTCTHTYKHTCIHRYTGTYVYTCIYRKRKERRREGDTEREREKGRSRASLSKEELLERPSCVWLDLDMKNAL